MAAIVMMCGFLRSSVSYAAQCKTKANSGIQHMCFVEMSRCARLDGMGPAPRSVAIFQEASLATMR